MIIRILAHNAPALIVIVPVAAWAAAERVSKPWDRRNGGRP